MSDTSEYPYKIFHLKTEELMDSARNQLADEGDCKVENLFFALMSNGPRKPRFNYPGISIRDNSLREFEAKLKTNDNKRSLERNIRKINSAKELMDLGFYVEAASVDSKTANEAINLTTSVNKRWHTMRNKKVVATGLSLRDTTTYDIIQWFDEFFLKMPLGYLDMEKGIYATSIV